MPFSFSGFSPSKEGELEVSELLTIGGLSNSVPIKLASTLVNLLSILLFHRYFI